MSEQQVVEKITHLQSQIERLENFELGIRSTLVLAAFYSKRIKKYTSAL